MRILSQSDINKVSDYRLIPTKFTDYFSGTSLNTFWIPDYYGDITYHVDNGLYLYECGAGWTSGNIMRLKRDVREHSAVEFKVDVASNSSSDTYKIRAGYFGGFSDVAVIGVRDAWSMDRDYFIEGLIDDTQEFSTARTYYTDYNHLLKVEKNGDTYTFYIDNVSQGSFTSTSSDDLVPGIFVAKYGSSKHLPYHALIQKFTFY
jgi:hypothetical protein